MTKRKKIMNYDIFFKSCVSGDVDRIKRYLDDDDTGDMDEFDMLSGFSGAIRHGKLNIVKYLIDSGYMEIDMYIHWEMGSNNDTPFEYACKCGQLEIAKYFVKDKEMDVTKTAMQNVYNKNYPNLTNKKLIKYLYDNTSGMDFINSLSEFKEEISDILIKKLKQLSISKQIV